MDTTYKKIIINSWGSEISLGSIQTFRNCLISKDTCTWCPFQERDPNPSNPLNGDST